LVVGEGGTESFLKLLLELRDTSLRVARRAPTRTLFRATFFISTTTACNSP